jgi:type IV secretory pathway TrbL component
MPDRITAAHSPNPELAPLTVGLPRIAVLGAGHAGPVIARVAVQAGYQVSIAASGDPEAIELITALPAPAAAARWAADAVADSNVVVRQPAAPRRPRRLANHVHIRQRDST